MTEPTAPEENNWRRFAVSKSTREQYVDGSISRQEFEAEVDGIICWDDCPECDWSAPAAPAIPVMEDGEVTGVEFCCPQCEYTFDTIPIPDT